MTELSSEPDFLREFKAQGKWQVCTKSLVFAAKLRLFLFQFQIEDTPFNDEVTLTRKFGNERYVASF